MFLGFLPEIPISACYWPHSSSIPTWTSHHRQWADQQPRPFLRHPRICFLPPNTSFSTTAHSLPAFKTHSFTVLFHLRYKLQNNTNLFSLLEYDVWHIVGNHSVFVGWIYISCLSVHFLPTSQAMNILSPKHLKNLKWEDSLAIQ